MQDEYVDEREYYDELDLLEYDEEDVDYVKEILFQRGYKDERE